MYLFTHMLIKLFFVQFTQNLDRKIAIGLGYFAALSLYLTVITFDGMTVIKPDQKFRKHSTCWWNPMISEAKNVRHVLYLVRTLVSHMDLNFVGALH